MLKFRQVPESSRRLPPSEAPQVVRAKTDSRPDGVLNALIQQAAKHRSRVFDGAPMTGFGDWT